MRLTGGEQEGHGRCRCNGSNTRSSTPFFALLARRIAVPSSSHEPDQASALDASLRLDIGPYLTGMGFEWIIYPNPSGSDQPPLVARRIEVLRIQCCRRL